MEISRPHKQFLEKVKRLELRFPVAEIGEKTGMSKGNISAYINLKKEPSRNFLKKFDEAFPDQNYPNNLLSDSELPLYQQHSGKFSGNDLDMQAIVNLTEANKLLAEAHKMFAQSQTKYAEANLKLAMNNEQLIALTKATVQNNKETPPAVDARYADLLELLADVAAGKRYKSKQEVLALLSKQLYDGGVEKPVVDTQKN